MLCSADYDAGYQTLDGLQGLDYQQDHAFTADGQRVMDNSRQCTHMIRPHGGGSKREISKAHLMRVSLQ